MSITLHPRISDEHAAALDRIAKRERFPPSRNKIASDLLMRAIDAEDAPNMRRCAYCRAEAMTGSSVCAAHKAPAQRGSMGITDPPPHLLDVRRRLGLRQRDVAEQAGVSVDKVRRTEKGAPMPPELRAWVEEMGRAKDGGS